MLWKKNKAGNYIPWREGIERGALYRMVLARWQPRDMMEVRKEAIRKYGTLSCVYYMLNYNMMPVFLPSYSVFFLLLCPSYLNLSVWQWCFLISYVSIQIWSSIWNLTPQGDIEYFFLCNPIGYYLDCYVLAIYGISNLIASVVIVSVFYWES